MPITVIPRGTNTNPWETLAAGVAGNVISDLLGQIRQNDQNRKINAFKSQVAQDIDNYIRGAGEGIALSPQNLPQGYNSNPWASKQHETYSPLTQFDLGTAPQTLTTPAIPAANVPQDISRIVNNLAGTKRFSMLNPDIVTGVRDDAVKMAEARRILGLQEKFANDYADAGSWDDRVNVLTNAGLQGLPVADQMKNFITYAMHRQPHFTLQDTNTGGSIVQSLFNPGTGQVTEVGRFTKTASPDEILRANTSLGVAKTNADASRDVANIHAGGTRYVADAESNIKLIEGLQKRLTDVDTAYNAAYQEIISSNDPKKIEQALENSDTLKRLAAEKTALQGQLYELYSRLGTGSYGGGSQNNEPINHSFSGAINNGGEYGDLINKYAEEYNIDPDLLYAVIQVESGHKNGLTSDKGAQGLMQIIPSTAKYLGIKNVFDPDENIRGGTRYLRELLDKYNGDVEKALRAYNAGPGTVDAGRNPNPSYSRNVLAIYQKRKQARGKQNSQSQSQPVQTRPAASPQRSFFNTVRQTTAAPINAKKQREAVNNVALGIADRGNPQITALGGLTNIPPEAVLIAPNGRSWITAEEIHDTAFNDNVSAESVMERLLANGFMYPYELGGTEQSQRVEQPQQTQAVQTQTENQNPTLWTDLKYLGGKVKDFINLIPNSPSYQDYVNDAYSPQYRGETEAQTNFEKLTSGDPSAIIPRRIGTYQPNASQIYDLSPIPDIDWTGNEWLRDLQLRNLPEIIAQYRDKNRNNSGEKLPLNFTYPFTSPLDIRQQLVDPFAFPPNGYFMYQ